MRALVLLFLLAGSSAFADPKQASVHDKQGKAFFDAGKYDDAIAAFKKSYEQDKKPVTLFKIAQAHYKKGDYQSAIDFYQQYLQAAPEGPLAKEAVQFTTVAKQKLDDERAKAKAAEDERKRLEEEQRRAQEQEKKKAAIAGHIKNAEAFVNAATWTSAGDEYMAACLAGGDATLMIDAGDAYRKQPNHPKAIEAYRAYLDRVPTGARSDEARTKLADVVREQEAEQKRVATAAQEQQRLQQEARDKRDDVPKGPPPIARGISSYGGRIAGGVMQPANNPIHVRSDDGLVAKPSIDVGAFVRYQLSTRVAVRPEVSIVYRSGAFDGQMDMMNGVDIDALIVKRAGIQLAVPLYITFGDDGDGFRLGAGPWVGLMPYVSSKNKPGYPSAGDAELFDVGVFAAAEYDLGLISLEFRFGRSLHQMTSDIDATGWIGLLGLTVGFDAAR